MENNIIGIRFNRCGKLYHFDASNVEDLDIGDFVVVNTSRGTQIGEVAVFVDPSDDNNRESWKPIERKANPIDLARKLSWDSKASDVQDKITDLVKEIKLENVKVVNAEIDFSGDQLTILYSSDLEGDVNLKALPGRVHKAYPEFRIAFRRIGPRDVAKLIGGLGACGMESRCCTRFLTEFNPISIKMAKAQNISLDPSEITGMCGRLRCCLIYEYEQYLEARKELPKRKSRVITPKGEGKVLNVNIIQETVLVRLDGQEPSRMEFHKDEIEPWNELEELRRKALSKDLEEIKVEEFPDSSGSGQMQVKGEILDLDSLSPGTKKKAIG